MASRWHAEFLYEASLKPEFRGEPACGLAETAGAFLSGSFAAASRVHVTLAVDPLDLDGRDEEMIRDLIFFDISEHVPRSLRDRGAWDLTAVSLACAAPA